jgi:hypothetical protein
MLGPAVLAIQRYVLDLQVIAVANLRHRRAILYKQLSRALHRHSSRIVYNICIRLPGAIDRPCGAPDSS